MFLSSIIGGTPELLARIQAFAVGPGSLQAQRQKAAQRSTEGFAAAVARSQQEASARAVPYKPSPRQAARAAKLKANRMESETQVIILASKEALAKTPQGRRAALSAESAAIEYQLGRR